MMIKCGDGATIQYSKVKKKNHVGRQNCTHIFVCSLVANGVVQSTCLCKDWVRGENNPSSSPSRRLARILSDLMEFRYGNITEFIRNSSQK